MNTQTHRPRSRLRHVAAFLSKPWLPVVLAGLGMGLALPSIDDGLLADDYLHRESLLDPNGNLSAFRETPNIFEFLDGTPEQFNQLMESGFLPWWTYEKVKISFYRPVSKLSHWLDYRVLGGAPVLMHAHSILLYGILILISALFYRQSMGAGAAAGLAALLFAVDDAHGLAAGWIAQRNALLAAIFGVLTILAHMKWRAAKEAEVGKASLHGAVVGPVLYTLCLLSAEVGISAGAYILAYEFFMVRPKTKPQFYSVALYSTITVIWYSIYRSHGFGAEGSGLYIDPHTDGVLFVTTMLSRMPLMFFGQWSFFPIQFLSIMPGELKGAVYAVAFVFAALTCVVLWPLIRSSKEARFLGGGMLLSLPPACIAAPDNRNLMFFGLGAMGLLSLFLCRWIGGPLVSSASKWRAALLNVFGFAFVLMHLCVSPVAFPLASSGLAKLYRANATDPLARLHGAEATGDKTLVFVNPPAAFMLKNRLQDGSPLARQTRVLCSSLHAAVVLTRTGEHTFELQPENGFLDIVFDKTFRADHHPLAPGQEVMLSNMKATVLSVSEADQRPTRVRFEFAEDLDADELLFIKWNNRDFATFSLPAIGEVMTLPRGELVVPGSWGVVGGDVVSKGPPANPQGNSIDSRIP